MLVYPFPKPERIVHTCVLRHLVFLYYTVRFVQLLWRACQEFLRTPFLTNLHVDVGVGRFVTGNFMAASTLGSLVLSN